MKKHLLLSFFLLSSLFVSFSSCEQNCIDENINKNLETTSFIYHGVSYSYNSQNINRNTYCSKPQSNRLHLTILSNPNLATLINENGNIEYFDSYEELIAQIKNRGQSAQNTPQNSIYQTRTPTYAIKITVNLYINVNYKGGGKILTHYPGDLVAPYVINDLSTVGLLNKISSLKINSETSGQFDLAPAYITLWDQKNFNGRSVTWKTRSNWVEAEPDVIVKVPNLYNVKRGLDGQHWNDAAQSIKFGYIY